MELPREEMDEIQAAAGGDRAAFTRLHERHRAMVLRRLSHLVGPGATVDDLLQETFWKAYRALSTFRGECPFPYWLLRIATRCAFAERRRARRSIWRLFVAPDEERAALAQAAAARCPELTAVHAALDHLSPRLREAVILFELEGRTLAEIGAELGLPIATVAARVRRGRARLKKHLVRAGYDELGEARLTLCTGETT
jgi:RNA polymerase sigma-70 factor (ECF subfamily)